MDRSNPRLVQRLIACACLTVFVAAAGCMGPMLTAMYLMGGMDKAAEYKGLRGKTVAVVCRPMVQLKYRDMSASKTLGREVGVLLKKNAKAKIIDAEKVAEWLDSNSSDECLEVGRALKADMVVAIDLLNFDIYEGQTLYKGKANYVLKVYDCKTGDVVFEKTPDQCVWPPNASIPTSEKQESQFRRKFVGIMAEEIARYFYSHDPRVDFAGDATALD
jgi:hypothetical protein